MADYPREYDTNPIDYDTESSSKIIEDGLLLCYYNHPDYDGVISFIGDGVTELGSLTPRYSPNQEKLSELQSVSSGTFIDCRIHALATSTTELRITIVFNGYIKQDASTITFPTAFIFRQSDGTHIYSVSAAETVSIDTVGDNTVTGIITTTGLVQNENGCAIGAGITVSLS